MDVQRTGTFHAVRVDQMVHPPTPPLVHRDHITEVCALAFYESKRGQNGSDLSRRKPPMVEGLLEHPVYFVRYFGHPDRGSVEIRVLTRIFEEYTQDSVLFWVQRIRRRRFLLEEPQKLRTNLCVFSKGRGETAQEIPGARAQLFRSGNGGNPQGKVLLKPELEQLILKDRRPFLDLGAIWSC